MELKDVSHDMNHWKSLADNMAAIYGKRFKVIKNHRDEYLVFPISYDFGDTVYETEE